MIYPSSLVFYLFFFNDTAPTEIYPLPLHDALPISVQSMLAPTEILLPGGSRPAMANAYSFPWARRSGPGIGEGSTATGRIAFGSGTSSTKSPSGCGGRLGSTCCKASARPPYHAALRAKTANGNDRPPPAFRETLYNDGELKKRAPATRVPIAGFTNGSESESASAIETLPMPRLFVGKI